MGAGPGGEGVRGGDGRDGDVSEPDLKAIELELAALYSGEEWADRTIRALIAEVRRREVPVPRGACGYRWHDAECNCGGAGGDR